MGEESGFELNPEPVREPPTLDISQLEDKSLLEETEEIPTMDDPNWSDYVMKQLEPDEVYEGRPTADGLRRVAIKLLGTIIKSCSKIVQLPSPENDNHATVEHTIVIRCHSDNTDVREFTGVSDVYPGNTSNEFVIHAPGTASTKARGRALRDALALRNIITAEEVGSVPVENPTYIRSGQITWINNICQKNNISVNKFLAESNTGKTFQAKEGRPMKIEELGYADAIKAIKQLNEMQNGKKEISESIKGYEENWRE
jgi:hypothetical protein